MRLFRYTAALYLVISLYAWIIGLSIGRNVFFFTIICSAVVEIIYYIRNKLYGKQVKEEQGREDLYGEEHPDRFI